MTDAITERLKKKLYDSQITITEAKNALYLLWDGQGWTIEKLYALANSRLSRADIEALVHGVN